MINRHLRMLPVFAVYSVLTAAFSFPSFAAVEGGPALGDATYKVTVEVSSVNINKEPDSEVVLFEAEQGESFQVIEDMGNGWVRVVVGDDDGYLPAEGNATISAMSETDIVELEEARQDIVEELDMVASAAFRENLVEFAKQFLGGRYVYGGNDPNSGVDCSGFTRYVMKYGAGVAINRSAVTQATQGVAVAAEQMQPGDLVFYGAGSGINHVAMYIGNGQVIHASTYKTGIKTSPWNYRTPVKIVNVLG